MDAIPCRLVFLALFFGARIQHTEGTGNALSSACCMRDFKTPFVRFCAANAGSLGPLGGLLFVCKQLQPQRVSFCKDGAGQSETERERNKKERREK